MSASSDPRLAAARAAYLLGGQGAFLRLVLELGEEQPCGPCDGTGWFHRTMSDTGAGAPGLRNPLDDWRCRVCDSFGYVATLRAEWLLGSLDRLKELSDGERARLSGRGSGSSSLPNKPRTSR